MLARQVLPTTGHVAGRRKHGAYFGTTLIQISRGRFPFVLGLVWRPSPQVGLRQLDRRPDIAAVSLPEQDQHLGLGAPKRGIDPPTSSETRSRKKNPSWRAHESPRPQNSSGRVLLALVNMRGVTGLRFVTGPLLRLIPSSARRTRYLRGSWLWKRPPLQFSARHPGPSRT